VIAGTLINPAWVVMRAYNSGSTSLLSAYRQDGPEAAALARADPLRPIRVAGLGPCQP